MLPKQRPKPERGKVLGGGHVSLTNPQTLYSIPASELEVAAGDLRRKLAVLGVLKHPEELGLVSGNKSRYIKLWVFLPSRLRVYCGNACPGSPQATRSSGFCRHSQAQVTGLFLLSFWGKEGEWEQDSRDLSRASLLFP